MTLVAGATGGAGDGGKKPNQFFAAGGDKQSSLWLYETRSAKLQIQVQGLSLGPHQRVLAVHRDDDEAYLAPTSLRFRNEAPTVLQFFGMNTQRGYYDSNVEAVIQQAAASNRIFIGDNRCSRCQSTRANIQFANCAQSYYQGQLLNFGACNKCVLNGNTTRCSFYSEPALPSGQASPQLGEIISTNTIARPNHPAFPSARARERASSNASRSSAGPGGA
ncbi:hypothetical protein COCMIDRAFT_2771 [Bipolaris oryzae ATCC 44560]|uniref:Uncharacterized protein n=1 Tax=Bipolaris oryzae ATCC 44560 TaxID=930090 RepID=W6ZLC7_COCMI|nr:uncharacterized protein COCMIDRAFT_2771 [Bipolaris oryzae ATCC 44560]EUC48329.1 hypothetical protein COCMIDRAFT_2771 [Bipolaris oryzae ATCC 44560]